MKQTLSMLLLAATIISSCSKSSDNKTTKSTSATLLTEVTDNTSGDPYIGKPLYQFTYNGKQLTQAVINHYSITPDVETDLFNYDSNGHLTGTTISHTQANSYNDVSSAVTYDGSNISEIKFYLAGNVLDRDIKLTYTNGKLSNWFNGNEVSDTYTYDNNGNNTKEVAAEYQSGQADGSISTMTSSTFDSKSNLTQAVPLWAYFRVYTEDQCLFYTLGTNNPVASNDNGTAFTYTYQYNSYGYPSAISWNDNYLQSYTYQYTQVN
jgi:YD repeat-containing protein